MSPDAAFAPMPDAMARHDSALPQRTILVRQPVVSPPRQAWAMRQADFVRRLDGRGRCLFLDIAHFVHGALLLRYQITCLLIGRFLKLR
ncbi:hypothetical protein [Janthinobacterium sp. SUN033]|uniref:hypothetical protein n=1 Tax=Janthinobacterium sp. SUN033 TaxID=3002439 RepID=UPI0025AED961|nr:hypothetical protein [Janthinobacterium sp. SUN033]MDN2679415.1 hypothetical protein [Janthinobacterium sp. SUN033]